MEYKNGHIDFYTLTVGVYKRTSEQVVEEPVNVIKTVETEHVKTDVPVGKIKCVDRNANQNFCSEYIIYRTLAE